ncbi:MAG: acylphosphatase [Anaerolineales bacterium]|nr:acylphosphatase [Anaerolineales bacterium]
MCGYQGEGDVASVDTRVDQDIRRLRVVVRGRVQGVNFRHYTLRAAQRLGVTGWVINRRDGTVETVAEGPSAALERFRASVAEGPPNAFVAQVDVEWGPATGEFSDFRVRYL